MLAATGVAATSDLRKKGCAYELSGDVHYSWRHHLGGTCSGTFLNLAIVAGAIVAHFIGDWLAPAHPYLDDFLASLILMGVTGALVHDQRHAWIVRPFSVLFVVTFAAFVWEVVAPRVLAASTSDWWDVLAYYTGGAAYIGITGLRVRGPLLHAKPTERLRDFGQTEGTPNGR